ncbi:MAG: hypothetical protein ACOCQ2_01060 [Halanaerobiales bacterium]
MLMLKSWLADTSKKKIREILKSNLKIDYDFTLEWCERQAREEPECDCGCWGYPVEIGVFWFWNKNKYRGCSNCGEDIK